MPNHTTNQKSKNGNNCDVIFFPIKVAEVFCYPISKGFGPMVVLCVNGDTQ